MNIYRKILSALARFLKTKIRFAVFFGLTFFLLELDLQEILTCSSPLLVEKIRSLVKNTTFSIGHL